MGGVAARGEGGAVAEVEDWGVLGAQEGVRFGRRGETLRFQVCLHLQLFQPCSVRWLVRIAEGAGLQRIPPTVC